MTDKIKTLDAPLVMPPYADFVAWLRADPSRVFPAKPDSEKRIGMVCPVGVFAREHNKGEWIGVSHTHLLRTCGGVGGGAEPIDPKYYRPICLFDTLTGFMSRSTTAEELLKELDKANLL